MVSALTLAQAAGGGGLALTLVVAVVGAVLAALVTLFGLRLTAHLVAIEKGQGGLVGAFERLERRLDDGLARVGDRFDRLYMGRRPLPSEDLVDPCERRHDDGFARLTDRIDCLTDRIDGLCRGQGEEERER